MYEIVSILITLVQAYSFLMFVWVILSWLPDLRSSSFYRFLDNLFEPLLKPIRQIIPPINGIDISPILGFFVLSIITKMLALML